MRLPRAGAALDGQRLGQPLLLLQQSLLHALQLRQFPVGAVEELPGARALLARPRHSTVSTTGQCALSDARECGPLRALRADGGTPGRAA